MSNNHNIILNYPEIRVDNPQLITDNLGNISIQSTFIGKPNEPNVIYSTNSMPCANALPYANSMPCANALPYANALPCANALPYANALPCANALPQNFQAEKLYIYSRIHDLKFLDYDGELIIKNKSHTTQQVIYTIFLLKTRGLSILTDFISNVTKQSLQIDELLKHPTKSTYLDITAHKFDKYLVYTDKSANQIVIIDTNIIHVSEDVSKYSNTQTLFRLAKNYDIVNSNQSVDKSVDKSVEGFSIDSETEKLINDNANGDYLICDNLPIDSTEELNYMVPASSPVVDALAQNSSMRTMINYIVYFAIFIAVYLGSPPLYKAIFVSNWLNPVTYTKTLVGTISHFAYFFTICFNFIAGLLIEIGIFLNIPILAGGGVGMILNYLVAVLAIKNNPVQSEIDVLKNTSLMDLNPVWAIVMPIIMVLIIPGIIAILFLNKNKF